ncbi:MAG TPA: DUF1127 domain-containing protein [Gammaproteobacteria bacterium]|nr:DUF1127 domain-containing protein [Gammaproteobacteria bacterium]
MRIEWRTVFSQAAATLKLWYQRARQRRRLAQLDEHLLRDIGITPEQARREARKPFWR